MPVTVRLLMLYPSNARGWFKIDDQMVSVDTRRMIALKSQDLSLSHFASQLRDEVREDPDLRSPGQDQIYPRSGSAIIRGQRSGMTLTTGGNIERTASAEIFKDLTAQIAITYQQSPGRIWSKLVVSEWLSRSADRSTWFRQEDCHDNPGEIKNIPGSCRLGIESRQLIHQAQAQIPWAQSLAQSSATGHVRSAGLSLLFSSSSKIPRRATCEICVARREDSNVITANEIPLVSYIWRNAFRQGWISGGSSTCGNKNKKLGNWKACSVPVAAPKDWETVLEGRGTLAITHIVSELEHRNNKRLRNVVVKLRSFEVLHQKPRLWLARAYLCAMRC
ncbi:hypothetical protein FIBSPDRAFT_887411 [Athelia psychrophila]|uniref:Uncharacterized protein n=1 Tax=Athelia psychrophila TaxID=1759441 RepID=A0A166PQ75_9AGAM|nr:hypothetical protein FIBSPDRAFT_887411 [Fibularhizoctonia sp. CBS 109695]